MRDQTVTTMSANGLDSTTYTDSAGNGVFNLITTTATVNNSDGSTTTTQTDYANNGSMLDQTVTTVSADGLTTTTRTDSLDPVLRDPLNRTIRYRDGWQSG